MIDDILTDSELDALLSAPSEPIIDDGFTLVLLERIERREKLRRTIPFAFGLIGAVITSFFIPTEIFYDLATALSNKESLMALASNPMAVALILSTPLALLLVRSD